MRYEYECPVCGIVIIEHSIHINSIEKCPNCNNNIKKLISKTAGQNVIFVGDGWADKKPRKDVRDSSVTDDERIERRTKAKKVLRNHQALKHKKQF